MLARVSRRTILQEIADSTYGVVTPANALDAAAFLGAAWAAPRLATWPGIAAAVASYGADIADGKLARATGTTSRVGDLIDHIGDKPKVAFALYHIWTQRLADRRLVAAVAAYNAATASLTVYDRLANGTSHVEVTSAGKRAMFATVTGIGCQAIATKLSETHPAAGRALRRGAGALVCAGLAAYGLPAIRQYWRAATGARTP